MTLKQLQEWVQSPININSSAKLKLRSYIGMTTLQLIDEIEQL